ncbi:MAG: zf-HC2 domain-containing protein [Candidatus Hydrogenedentes bacterium]|nr:zf-HC2 domain-containing protein [Candidatus Hydrogenedentota bacterium]MBI3118939.1 zf-HC2 domain-containing protein [Candidatus Hydrogenedentota bacterium]
MSKACEQYEILISGYLDGELDEGQSRTLEQHVESCSVCRREFETMKRLMVGTSASFRLTEPPDAVWDTFLDNIYNQLERRIGWGIALLGLLALAAYGVVLFYYEPWASNWIKVLLTLPALGLIVIFVSVLRQRLRAARTDRYSQGVHR